MNIHSVKMHKKNDPALLGAYPIGAESLRPSCRPLGFTSQPPPGAGSHLYPAQQDSARWGHRVGRISALLVGLTDSRGSHPQPYGVLGSAIPSLALCDCSIA